MNEANAYFKNYEEYIYSYMLYLKLERHFVENKYEKCEN